MRPAGRQIIPALLVVGLGVGAPILARLGGLAEALSILGLIAGYDLAAYIVGTGAENHWEGPAAGIATVAAGTLAVAALAEPPFTLVTAGALGLIIAIAGPLGPTVVRRIAPLVYADEYEQDEAGAPEEAPAVRRLSTFLAAGPALLVLIAVVRLVN